MVDPTPQPPAPRSGLFLATVVDNADPEQAGRLRLRIPSVHPTDVHPWWALPFGVSWGASAQRWIAPEIGATVVVQFVEGNAAMPMWSPGAFPPGRDENGRPTAGKVPEAARSRPGQLADAYPKKRVLHSDDRGLLITENEAGEVDMVTRSRPVRIKTLGANIEIDARDGSGGEVIINRGTAAAARTGDSVTASIPIGAVLVGSPGGPIPNVAPIPLDAVIGPGSTTVKIG